MLDKLKEMWAKWNVQVKVVGGVLVVATIWGTCTYEPNLTGQSGETEAQEAQDADPVSNDQTTETTTTEATTTEATTTEVTEGETTATESE